MKKNKKRYSNMIQIWILIFSLITTAICVWNYGIKNSLALENIIDFMGASWSSADGYKVAQRNKGSWIKTDSNVKIEEINQDTQMPAEYNFFLNQTDETEIYRTNQETIEGKYDEIFSLLTQYNKTTNRHEKIVDAGECYAWYRKIGVYNEEYVDLKMTLMDYTLSPSMYERSNDEDPQDKRAGVLFYDGTGCAGRYIDVVNVKYEFFYHNTSIDVKGKDIGQINTILQGQVRINGIKGFMTATDVDYDQGIVFKTDQIDKIYFSEQPEKKWLRYAQVNEGIYIYALDRVASVPEDRYAWVTTLFNTGTSNALDVIYTFPANISTGGMLASPVKLVPTQVAAPTKSIIEFARI